MVDVASLLFMAGGALSYPLFFHLSLKKSLSLVSREKVANGRVLLSLVILYLETVALVMLSTPLSFIPPSYFGSLIALSAIVLLASFTLKALFGLSLRRGILAFALWQVLCLMLGATLMTTVLAAMFQTILTIIPILALMFLAWWMWGGRLGIGAGRITAGESEKRVTAIVIVALLCSSLLVPSAITVVRCDPQSNSTEQDVDVNFNWNNKTVSGNIVWNTTQTNTAGQGTTGTATTGTGTTSGQANSQTGTGNYWTDIGQGLGEGAIDYLHGFWIPWTMQNLHDASRDLEYLYLITDITKLRDIAQGLNSTLPSSGPYHTLNSSNSKDPSRTRVYVKDVALANKLANMSRKEFKVEVADHPDVISKAINVERYVEDTAWTSAAANLLGSNIFSAIDAYQRITAQTGDWLQGLYAAGRVFGLSAPLLECYEAGKSGDGVRLGKAIASAFLTYGTLALILDSAWNVYQGQGLAAGVASAAYDLTVGPLTSIFSIADAGFSGITGALSDISDVGLRTYLEGAMADLKGRLTGYEYIPFTSSDEEVLTGVMPNEVLSNVGGINVVPSEETFDWAKIKIFADPSIAKKVSSESWVRYFINAIKDYQKLDQIGEGETEILGLKIKMEKGIVQAGNPDSIGKSYFDLKIVDTGSMIRIYEDNTISVWNNGAFRRLIIEQLEADTANTEPLKTDGGTRSDRRTNPGTHLTTILMRDYLEKIGFFDRFVIGQETEEVFGVKGTVKANGVSTDGPYVIIEFEADTGRGSIVREVRITADGATVNSRSIVDVETGEDGAVYLLYKNGDHISRTPIKLPDPFVYGKLVKAEYLTTGFDYNDIVGKTGAVDLFGELDIKNPQDFTRRVAYAVQGGNEKAFDAKYGEGKCEALWDAADVFSKSAAEEASVKMGFKVREVDVVSGVRPSNTGVDILITTEDGKELKLDIEYAGQEGFSRQTSNMVQKFKQGKADLGMIFWEGKYYVFINSATKYGPLANIAIDITRASSRSIKDFAGIAVIGGLGLLTGNFTDANGKSASVTDDAGRWIGEFQDSYLDHTVINSSTILNSSLTLSSVEGSYLQDVRSAGSTIVGSTITDSNVSAKLISNSIIQNTLAVCSTIVNSDINNSRILNSTLVSVMGLNGSHVEDSSIAYSAGITNCTVMRSKLMSVVNLSNSSITGSNLTMVANMDNTNVTHSDISYSANITRSDIVDTKLVSCTVQGSNLTSCTAVNSKLREVNATNTKLTGTNADYSNLVNVNATNSTLTNANVKYSNLKNVELNGTEVIGTDLTNMKLANQTIVYGRLIEFNDDIKYSAPRVGTPNYSGQSTSSSTSKTTDDASSGTTKAGSTTSSITTSSSSGQTQTSSAKSSDTQISSSTQTQSQAVTSQQKTSNTNSQVPPMMKQKLGQQASNVQTKAPSTQTQPPNTKASGSQTTASQQKSSTTGSQQIPPMIRQKLGGQAQVGTSSSAQTSSSTQTKSPQQTTTTTSQQTSTTTSQQQTAEKPVRKGVNIWIN